MFNSEKQLDNCKWKIEVPSYMDLGENISKRQTNWDDGIRPDYKISQTYDDYVKSVITEMEQNFDDCNISAKDLPISQKATMQTNAVILILSSLTDLLK